MTTTDDGQRAESYLPPTTFDSATGRIKGTDGEWYDVPEPVLVRYMTALGLSSLRGKPPMLVRSGRDFAPEARVEPLPDVNASLLLTDGLLSQVTAYLEDGEIAKLVDLIEMVYELADRRGIGRNVVMAAVASARMEYGGFDTVLMPDA